MYGGYMDLQRMVYADGFKLVYYPKVDVTLLFDTRNDPLEMVDLADRPESQDKRRTVEPVEGAPAASRR